MSDSEKYALPLARHLKYTNTFYHQEPRLNIQSPPPDFARRFKFVISSDVFEHVSAPIQSAFDSLHNIMAPGGTLILTVPFSLDEETVENFPHLYRYSLENDGNGFVLCNTKRNGEREMFRDPVFHGGPGSTLEIRLFSREAIVKHLKAAGFSDIRVHTEPAFEWGIYWSAPWSVPISALA